MTAITRQKGDLRANVANRIIDYYLANPHDHLDLFRTFLNMYLSCLTLQELQAWNAARLGKPANDAEGETR